MFPSYSFSIQFAMDCQSQLPAGNISNFPIFLIYPPIRKANGTLSRGFTRFHGAKLRLILGEVVGEGRHDTFHMARRDDDPAIERPRWWKHIEKVHDKFFLRMHHL